MYINRLLLYTKDYSDDRSNAVQLHLYRLVVVMCVKFVDQSYKNVSKQSLNI